MNIMKRSLGLHKKYILISYMMFFYKYHNVSLYLMKILFNSQLTTNLMT